MSHNFMDQPHESESTLLTGISASEYESEISYTLVKPPSKNNARRQTVKIQIHPKVQNHNPSTSSQNFSNAHSKAISKGSVRHDVLNLVTHEAEIEDNIKGPGDSDPEEEIHCCACWKTLCKCRNKNKEKIPRFMKKKQPQVIIPKLTKKEKLEICMQKLQIIAKWVLVFIGVFDFCMAIQDSYIIVRRDMKHEYFFLQRIYNCDRLMTGGYRMKLYAHVLHGLMSVSLLFIHNKENCGFALYWIGTQIMLILVIVGETMFKTRYISHPLFSLIEGLWRLCIDLIQLFIVIFRFYKLYNPFTVRLKKLASTPKLDRTINHELKLRTSNFIKRKAAVREAANIHTLETIKKLHNISVETGIRPDPKVAEEEIHLAIKRVFHSVHRRRSASEAELKVTSQDSENNLEQSSNYLQV